MTDKFWYEDPNILFNNNRLLVFFPDITMNFNEKLNSLSRLSIYLGLILFLYNGNFFYLYIPIITLLLTYFLYKSNKNDKIIEFDIQNINCVYPTKENPFMNPLLTDIEDNPDRISCIEKYPNMGQKNINDKFNINLYRDLSDVFQKTNSQRQYYTVPSTTIPNKQNKFAKWLYNTPKTCKEGNGAQCVANNYTHLYSDNQYNLI